MKSKLITTLTLIVFCTTPLLYANDGSHRHSKMHHSIMDGHAMHDGHFPKKMAKDMESMSAEHKMYLVKKNIDGYDVSFHVMPAKKSMEHGGSHNLMVKIEKNGKALENIKINSKVKFPDGKSSTKMLIKMGSWFMAVYDLSNEGEHQLMVLFKTDDGKKHFGGVHYPLRSK